MHRDLTLALFVALVLGGGTLIGFMTLPGAWYAGLAKPPFNPPNWIFAPAWTLLYVLVAVAGWRTWQRGPRERRHGGRGSSSSRSISSWSPVFFGAHTIPAPRWPSWRRCWPRSSPSS